MKTYNKLLFVFLTVFFTVVVIAQLGIKSQFKDKYKQKIFSEKQTSLLIGTSKAEKLNVDAMNKVLDGCGYSTVYNYAFNLGMSPYGPLYNQSILNKIKRTEGEKQVFILAIDPWAVSSTNKAPDDSTLFGELDTPIKFIRDDSWVDDYSYFFQYYRGSYYTLFLPEKNEEEVEPTVEFVKKHTKSKIAAYRKINFENSAISQVRYSYFEELIDELKSYGQVVLVRLPVSCEMVSLEKEYTPLFQQIVNETAKKYNVEFLDFYDHCDQFLCTDGNHLFKKDAKEVSELIAEFILKNENQ